MTQRLHSRLNDVSGFVMLEMLVATVLMVVILTALATVTSRWMPNWNRGMAQVQQLESLAVGVDRVVADLAAAQFVTTTDKALAFDGSALSVTFVRTAIGPNARPGLETIRLAERADERGLALVRERGAFNPGQSASQIQFRDPVVLARSPYRISFSYAGANQNFTSDWRNSAELPRMVRVSVREAGTNRTLAASTVVVIQTDAAADCVRSKNISQCLIAGPSSEPNAGDKQPAKPNADAEL